MCKKSPESEWLYDIFLYQYLESTNIHIYYLLINENQLILLMRFDIENNTYGIRSTGW